MAKLGKIGLMNTAIGRFVNKLKRYDEKSYLQASPCPQVYCTVQSTGIRQLRYSSAPIPE
jgi:hypothetical protein